MRKESIEQRNSIRARLSSAVTLPVLLLALAVVGLAAWGLASAARQSDEISVQRQMDEVGLALSAAQDELVQSQTGVAIWDLASAELRRPHPDWNWVDTNIGSWLSSVYARESDFILNGDDRPVYAMTARKRVAPERYQAFASAIKPLVDAVRGRSKRAPNPHERLLGMPLNPHASLRTSARAIHATDLIELNGRSAVVSVMRIIPDRARVLFPAGREPLLVSIRLLDAKFLRDLADNKMIAGAHILHTAATSSGERAIPLIASRGQRLGYFIWRPDLPGTALLKSMAPIAALAVGLLIAALIILASRLANMMRSDARTLELLNVAHAELKEREAQAQFLAFHDALTGLPNRALFNRTVDVAFAEHDAGRPCAIMLLDLDRFKHVNDTHGHLAGDILLEQVAERLSDAIQAPDLVARLGGDEFAILVRSDASRARLDELQSRIVTALGAPFSVLGTTVTIGASVGAALHSDPVTRRSQVMREADLAMYQAKRQQVRDHRANISALPVEEPKLSSP